MGRALPYGAEDDEISALDLRALGSIQRVHRAAEQTATDQATGEFCRDVSLGEIHARGAGGKSHVAARADQHRNRGCRHQAHRFPL